MKSDIKFSIARGWHALAKIACKKPYFHHAPILCYHSINKENHPELYPVTPDMFERHIKHIKNNYKPISLDTLVYNLNNGLAVGSKNVVITFDDAYLDVFQHAISILKKYDVPATFFIPTGYVDGDVNFFPNTVWEPMSWDDLREIAANDLFTIGSHSHMHDSLSLLSDQEIKDDISCSIRRLNDELDIDIKHFAFPNGQGRDIAAGSLSVLRMFSFDSACSTFWRAVNSKKDLYSLNRVRVDRCDTIRKIDLKLKGAYDYIYYLHLMKARINKLFNKNYYSK